MSVGSSDGARPTRRDVVAGGAAVFAALASGAAAGEVIPVIDTHIHLFDPNRPQGAPYRGPKSERFYTEGASPENYRGVVSDQNVVGAIAVEASPWLEDNLWLLETARRSELMVGIIGNLRPDAPDFVATITRYARDPLFRGVRYGNLWTYDIVGKGDTAAFVDGARALADADLALDTANPRLDLLQAVVRVSDRVPGLRIIIDHLPHFEPRDDERSGYRAVLAEIAQRPNLFVKLSEVIHPVGGRVSVDLAAYRDTVDLLCSTFGDDRVIFGSDWPNILQDTPVGNEFAMMRNYFSAKSRAQQDKYFWRNSLRAYKWRPRSAAQRALVTAA